MSKFAKHKEAFEAWYAVKDKNPKGKVYRKAAKAYHKARKALLKEIML